MATQTAPTLPAPAAPAPAAPASAAPASAPPASAPPSSAAGFAAVSRAVVSAAADLVTGVQRAVVGPDRFRTARDNAWDAILADRARNQARDDLNREIAAILSRSR